MNTLAIWLPTYKRPHKLAAVVKNIRETTKNSYTLYFGIELGDRESGGMLLSLGQNIVVNRYPMGYSGTVQTMYEDSDEPIAVHINDDFEFVPNWDEHPVAMFETPQVMVVGVPQHESDKTYSAICFIRRKYIEEQSGVIDMPNRVFYPYGHNYQDTEFTRTAQKRGVWYSSSLPCINHLHPGYTGEAKDETYKKNDALYEQDRVTFESREHLWR